MLQIGEGDEFRDIDFIGAARFCIADVGEPFQLGRYVGEIAVLIRRHRPFAIDKTFRGYTRLQRQFVLTGIRRLFGRLRVSSIRQS